MQIVHIFKDANLEVDLSDNLSVPIPISLNHKALEQVSIHSGILKTTTHKSYHPYISDDKHDQHFIEICIKYMLSEVDNLSTYLHKGPTINDVPPKIFRFTPLSLVKICLKCEAPLFQ